MSQCEIGEIAELVRGVTFSKSDATSAGTDGSLPLLRATNVTEQGLNLDDLVYIPRALVRQEQQIHPGDILITMSSGSVAVVGRSVRLDRAPDATFGAFCGVLRPSSLVDSRYLSYMIAVPHVRQLWSDCAKGTNINNLKRDDVLKTSIPVPSLAEQKRIVEKLEQILPQVEAGRATVATAEEMVEDLFLSALSRTFRPSTSAPERTYAEVAQLSLGKMLDKSKATGRHKTPYLRNVNVRWGEFDMSDLSEMDIKPEELERVSVHRGDVVVCEGGEPGRCAVWREEESMAIQKALHRMRPTAAVDSDYLALNLEYQVKRGSAGELFTGTTIKHLTGEKLRTMRLPVPPLVEQQAAVEKLASVREACRTLATNHLAQQNAFSDLRQAVLDAAFRGEL